ncbi:MAG: hypothetical protein SH847_09685 [Roseiflexaceae bacterium]|nr:hypothetical protein [Roseiflexaceae bacterium]
MPTRHAPRRRRFIAVLALSLAFALAGIATVRTDPASAWSLPPGLTAQPDLASPDAKWSTAPI